MLDNYDSFTYNLVHYIEDILQQEIDVFRNDAIALAEVNQYDQIILSPGPGLPAEAGILLDLIKTYAPSKDILGICLGMQAIAESFGGRLYNLDQVYHGIATPVFVQNEYKLFQGLEPKVDCGRYHSWAVDANGLPECLVVTAKDEQGVIMGLQHKKYKVSGVQFHPESILTPEGYQMIKNWLS